MLKIIVNVFASFLILFMLGCSSNDPQSKLNEVDRMIGKRIPMTADQKSQVDQFVTKAASEGGEE